MLDDMYATEGCGLAAPQVGELIQLVVIDVDYTKSKRNPYVLINPRIVVADGEERETGEGCLSFPDLRVRLPRASHVVVDALDEEGREFRFEARGDLAAMCVQHETDHLDGITMVDRLGPVAKARAMSEYKHTHAET
jgi:peptide deformylase